MYVPFFTSSRKSKRSINTLERRKGGGGKGGAKGGGGGGGSSGGGSSGGKASSVPLSGSSKSTGGKSSASAYGNGGGKSSTIPSGQPFAGRVQGGGSRNNVYGSSTYGSGYPIGSSALGYGVAGAGFPFFFWPVVWGGGLGYGGAYLYNHDYGNSDNPDRPGGPMVLATFNSPTSNSTFRLLADNSTATSLIQSVDSSCTLGPSSTFTVPYNPNDTFAPRPEEAVQYYRASSVVLSLDGYNDTTVLQENPTGPDVPLPGWVDSTTLDCLNQTIGAAVPLIDGASTRWSSPGFGLIALVWVMCSYLVL